MNITVGRHDAVLSCKCTNLTREYFSICWRFITTECYYPTLMGNSFVLIFFKSARVWFKCY